MEGNVPAGGEMCLGAPGERKPLHLGIGEDQEKLLSKIPFLVVENLDIPNRFPVGEHVKFLNHGLVDRIPRSPGIPVQNLDYPTPICTKRHKEMEKGTFCRKSQRVGRGFIPVPM